MVVPMRKGPSMSGAFKRRIPDPSTSVAVAVVEHVPCASGVDDDRIRLHLDVPGVVREDDVVVAALPPKPVRRFRIAESVTRPAGTEPHAIPVHVSHDARTGDRVLAGDGEVDCD